MARLTGSDYVPQGGVGAGGDRQFDKNLRGWPDNSYYHPHGSGARQQLPSR